MFPLMYYTCTKTHDKNYLEKWKNRLQLNTCMVWDVIFFSTVFHLRSHEYYCCKKM